MKKNVLKAIVFIPVLILSWFLGAYLLGDYLNPQIFILLPYAIVVGYGVYYIFRTIDRKYNRDK